MTPVFLAIVLMGDTVFAQDELVEAGLSESELERFREGVEALAEERFRDAQGRFWRVHLTNREHPQTILGLGQAYRGDEKLSEAANWFDECAHVLDDCAFAAGEVALEIGNGDEAVDRLERLAGEQSPEVQRRVHWALMTAYMSQEDSQLALDAAVAFSEHEGDDQEWEWQEEHLVALLDLVALVREERGGERPWQTDEEARWPELLSVLGAAGEPELPTEKVGEVQSEGFRIEIEEAARRRFGGIDQALDAVQEELARSARQALSAKQWLQADGLLTRLGSEVPQSSEYWGLAGKLALERVDGPDWVKAERAFRLANKLAPSNQEWGSLLVALLIDGYGGRRDREALPILAELVAQNPTPERMLQMGDLHAKMGDYSAALGSFQAVIERWPDSPLSVEARDKVGALLRTVPDGSVTEVQLQGLEETVRQGAQWHYHLSVVLQGRGRSAEAIAEARMSVDLQPTWPVAINHLAGLLSDSKPREALLLWKESLEQAPDQLRVKMLRIEALLRLNQPSAALRELNDMVEDAPEYHLRRAEILEDQGERAPAIDALNRYFAEYQGAMFREEAQALNELIQPVSNTNFWMRLGAIFVAFLGISGLFWRRRKTRTGLSLAEFLERDPRSYHDLARVLSGMRHEVLKHNTTLLPTVADALEKGDRGPALDASGILLGGQGTAGVIELWDRYIGELEAIGHSHGVRLNLRYIDSQIAPMCEAFDELRQLAPRLHKGKGDSMAQRLRAVSHAVNDVGYHELGKLLHEVCVLRVDKVLLEEIWGRVAREPGIVGRGLLPPLLESDEALHVRVFREDFSDIVANLLRNGCEAVLAERPASEARVAIRVVEEMDPITGLSWVATRVLDNAKSELTNEMIQGRRIGRGIGLALDLAKRSSGSLVVEPEVGWSKAVVLRLAMAEEAEA